MNNAMNTAIIRLLYGDKPQPDAPLTRADLDAYFKNNNPFQTMPVQGTNQLPFINPQYTQAAPMDNSLSPMAQLQAFRQNGQLPAAQNSFQPFQQPPTPMTTVPGGFATSTKGAK